MRYCVWGSRSPRQTHVRINRCTKSSTSASATHMAGAPEWCVFRPGWCWFFFLFLMIGCSTPNKHASLNCPHLCLNCKCSGFFFSFTTYLLYQLSVAGICHQLIFLTVQVKTSLCFSFYQISQAGSGLSVRDTVMDGLNSVWNVYQSRFWLSSLVNSALQKKKTWFKMLLDYILVS